MDVYQCACGAQIYFDNTSCLNCGRTLGFCPDGLVVVPDRVGEGEEARTPCARRAVGCNWWLAPGTTSGLCPSCQLRDQPVTPGAPVPQDVWVRRFDDAGRRLVVGLWKLGLPVVPKSRHARGLTIRYLVGGPEHPVTIGHAGGLVTLDLREADPAERERVRQDMGELYRTPLGHLRHEVGHYYWDLFFDTEPRRVRFRKVFGDERADYAASLQAHYGRPKNSAPADYVSHYATSHPWEDWAETWAHYLHLLASWETARSFGLKLASRHRRAKKRGLERKLDEWSDLMIALNALNRSLGHADPYPFVVPQAVREKLAFVDQAVRRHKKRLVAELVQEGPHAAF